MMKKLPLIVLIACVLSLVACRETCEDLDGIELIFGEAYGMCDPGFDHCAEVFRLTSTTLEEDMANVYPGMEGNNFNFQARSTANHAVVANLLTDFPLPLLSEPNGSIGCPDCRDQGMYYLQYSSNGVTQTWILDRDLDQLPDYLRSYATLIEQQVTYLKP